MMINRATTLLELLVVISLLGMLTALVLPAVGTARQAALDVRCTANLAGVGRSIHGFAVAHQEFVAPAVRENDYFWDRGEQRGWDITVGRWAQSDGGPGTEWHCPVGFRPYVGNSRALGLHCMPGTPVQRVYRVGPARWYEPARLVVAYDVQPDLIPILYKEADEPMVGDLSDEMDGRWPRDSRDPIIPADFGPLGPHREGCFGVLFADGHAATGTFPGGARAVMWSGPRWWPNIRHDSDVLKGTLD
jgi:prepilin-type processing-associated H-X9-DG protein